MRAISIMLFCLIAVILVFVALMVAYMTWMPSPRYMANEDEVAHENVDLKVRLKSHVVQLSQYETGRNGFVTDNLTSARDYIVAQFSLAGLKSKVQSYLWNGTEYSNVFVELLPSEDGDGVLVVGAHYDSVENSPGANDNASGVAALIEIARYLSGQSMKNKIELVAFVNEEAPYFQTEGMGSLVYARSLFERNEKVIGMISLETIGYYSDEPGSQKYPKYFDFFFTDKANFISFVGNLRSRSLLTKSISLFKKNSLVPLEGVASPESVPGVSWSDHWSFWEMDYPAIMITDTAFYRYPYYHQRSDTPEKLNYEKFAKVVYGLTKMMEGLANE